MSQIFEPSLRTPSPEREQAWSLSLRSRQLPLEIDGLCIERHFEQAAEYPDFTFGAYAVSIATGREPCRVVEVSPRPREATTEPGGLYLYSANKLMSTAWRDPLKQTMIFLGIERVAKVASDAGIRRGPCPELADDFWIRDASILYLGRQLSREFKEGNPHGRVYAETLRDALARRILASSSKTAPPSDRVSAIDSKHLRRIVEESLDKDCSMDALAANAGYSVWHFQRVFRSGCGETVHSYILRRRCERALEMLRAGTPVGIVASVVGFHDSSHLSRHFRSHFGATPGRIAREAQR